MEAPYRLKAILQDIKDIFVHRKIFVAFDLTMQSEKKFRGNASEILETIGEDNLKGEFLILIDKYCD
jgi:16S rRNA C1402 (ribose-2'-O) methylase RsmI